MLQLHVTFHLGSVFSLILSHTCALVRFRHKTLKIPVFDGEVGTTLTLMEIVPM